jgi:hypothetical protein
MEFDHSRITPEIREVYRKALEDLETNGWYQGHYFDVPDDYMYLDDAVPQNCASCALGAITRAGGTIWNKSWATPAIRDAMELMEEWAAIHGHGSVGMWNDDPARTEDDVKAAFRELAGERS